MNETVKVLTESLSKDLASKIRNAYIRKIEQIGIYYYIALYLSRYGYNSGSELSIEINFHNLIELCDNEELEKQVFKGAEEELNKNNDFKNFDIDKDDIKDINIQLKDRCGVVEKISTRSVKKGLYGFKSVKITDMNNAIITFDLCKC